MAKLSLNSWSTSKSNESLPLDMGTVSRFEGLPSCPGLKGWYGSQAIVVFALTETLLVS